MLPTQFSRYSDALYTGIIIDIFYHCIPLNVPIAAFLYAFWSAPGHPAYRILEILGICGQ